MQAKSPKSLMKVSRIILPTFLGLGVVVWLMSKEFDPKAFYEVQMNWKTVFWILIALLCMVQRDLGYIWRIRLLSHGMLSWKESFRVIMLWEFTSAVTPSAIGGTSVAIFYLAKEKQPVGKSTAMVLATSLLDEFYFVVMFPLVLTLVSLGNLFDMHSGVGVGLLTVTLVGYSVKTLWALAMSFGLFVKPQMFRWIIYKIFAFRLLRRLEHAAHRAGDDVVIASAQLRRQGWMFWFKALLATFWSWTSRYLVVNALFLAFFPFKDHLLLFARQLVMWMMMLVSPTPGGSGFAEYVFKEFLGDLIPVAGLTMALALLWRLISYYVYLLLGAFIVPKWIKDKF